MDENESLDTLFAGLVAEPVEQRSPFKFLDAYGAADRALFFGRDNEIRDLYARFYRGQALLVYGESGTGKTSLIECGLRSEIPTEEALFVTVRTAQDPFEAVQRALHRVLRSVPEGLELGSLVREVIEQKSKTLVLVFDQFEEFFLFQPASVRQAFAQEVQGWLEQNGNLRLVIGLREEYLARATELEPYWPGLFRNRLWIRHLARTDAETAIVGPCEVCGVEIEDGLVTTILADLSGGGSEVELPIFQVVLDSLYRKALAETPEHPRLTLGAYRELGQVQTILGRFLEERVQSYAEATEAARQILKALVTAEGTRQFGRLQDIALRARQFGSELTDEQVAELLWRLIDDRLVREDPDQHWYELRHDALAKQIQQWMSGLEQELVDLRQTLENRLREYQRHGRLLEADLLASLAPYENRLALRGGLAELVELSKYRVRRRKRWYFIMWTTLFALITVFGVFSFVQWQEAKQQKTQAEAHFKRAREAVDDLIHVSESTLFDRPGFELLRQNLLERARDYYQDMDAQRPGDREMQVELAKTAWRLGNIQRSLKKDRQSAEAAYHQAIANFEALAREYPREQDYQHNLASSHADFGQLLGDNNDIAGMRTEYQQAFDLWEQLVQTYPDVRLYQNKLLQGYIKFGDRLRAGGNTTGAEAAYQKALNLTERLVQKKYPEASEYQQQLAWNYRMLGDDLRERDTSGAAVARDAYQKAVGLWERLVQEHPDVLSYQNNLAVDYNRLGGVLKSDDAAEARALYQKALDLLEPLAREHPEDYHHNLAMAAYHNFVAWSEIKDDMEGARATYQKTEELLKRLTQEHSEAPDFLNLLAATQQQFGILLSARGDPAGARDVYQKAIGFWESLVQAHPEIPTYQNYLATSYNNLSNLLKDNKDAAGAQDVYQKAIDLWESLVQAHPEMPTYQNYLATSYNNLSNLLKDNKDAAGVKKMYQKAIDLWEPLVQAHPEVLAYRDILALSYNNLGVLLADSNKATGAEAAYLRSIDLKETLVQAQPDAQTYQHVLAISYFNLGILLKDGSDTARAQAAYQKAQDLYERLVREHPDVLLYQDNLATSYNRIGLLLHSASDVAGAREAFRKASESFAHLHREFPDQTDYRAKYAQAESNFAWTELLARRAQEAIAAANRGFEADPNQVAIRTYLAHGYLFDNQYAKALAIYTENKDVKLPDGRTFAEAVLANFQEFRAKGLDHPDMAKIERLLRGSGAGDQ